MMEQTQRRKQEIENRLSEEKKRSEMIKASLEKADQLTNSMVTILNQFDERLHKLEDTILPVHRKTKDLQRLQDNIEKTLSSLDHVISYHHVAHDVEPIVRQGPSRQVDKYLSCMERLVQAVNFFSENNPDSPELNTVNTLFTNGKDGLEKEFQAHLSRHTKPMPPQKVVEMIKAENMEAESYTNLPEKTMSDLSQMAEWLSGAGKSQSFVNVYSDIRSNNLIKTLNGLSDHIKGNNLNTGRKISVAVTTPKKPGNRRASNFRKPSTLLRKESLQSLSSMGGLGKSSHAPIAEEEIIEIEIEPFVAMVSACAKLFVVEQSMIQSVIPEKNRRQVFDSIITESLKSVEQAGNKIVEYAKQCITRHDHPSIVNVFPAIKHLKTTLPSYQAVLKGVSEMNRLRMPRLIGELETVGVKVLEDFSDCVKSDPEKESNMPKDGTVHELTSNTMLFMQQLADNVEIVGGMLASKFESQQSMEKIRSCLADYISQVLGALKLNLENKSRVYENLSLAAVFLLNNYHFIITALNRHNLLGLAEIATPGIENLYRGFIDHQKQAYLQCWNKFDNYLKNKNKGVEIQAQPGGKLKDKDKLIVKDKFKTFNNDFDDLVKTHQQWAMPSSEVRKEIRNSVKTKLVQPYAELHEKYRMVQFTKNIEKYLKYTPESVAENIDRMFGQNAS
uniref:exocyst complex component 7 isoform X1 n=1 Tax=Ciona intestinalis TaxID=7719 RepID=UPI00089DAE1E|nr:exocyst complex component 7 isoform X1 [Ciona intestinalis]|eukprot:XP_018673470.1 exocyst complex component 7 isoform X1 [Ciona intestinalis]